MILLVIILLFAYAAFISLLRLYRSYKAVRFITKETELHNNHEEADEIGDSRPNLIILLPCLNEQSIVEETLDHFTNMSSDNVLLVPITGESETEIKKNNSEKVHALAKLWWQDFGEKMFAYTNNGVFPNSCFQQLKKCKATSHNVEEFQFQLTNIYKKLPTTWDMIDNYIKKIDPKTGIRIHRLHDPKLISTKALKLNFAIRELEKNFKTMLENEFTYVGVYDFDSRPSSHTFTWLTRKIGYLNVEQQALPAIFQQTPYQLGNELYKQSPLSIERIMAVWHLERALAIETYGHYKRETWLQKAIVRGSMGAGLFVKSDEIKKIGYFPEYSDDIAFGYRSDWMNKRRLPIPFPNFVQPVKNPFALFKQFSRIWIGVFTVSDELKMAKRLDPTVLIHNQKLRTMLSYIQSITPVIQLVSILSMFLLCLFQSLYFAFTMLFAVYFIYSFVLANYHFLASKVIRNFTDRSYNLNAKNVVSSLLGAFHWCCFITTILAYYHIHRLTKRSNAEILFNQKTER